MSQPYVGQFPIGTRVRIAGRVALELFHREWGLHNPLQAKQLAHAGVQSVVSDVGFYHGGDVLYTLENVPGVWHERCLERV